MSDIPKDVRVLLARAYSDLAYLHGWDGMDAEEQEITLGHFDAALAALRAAGWAVVPRAEYEALQARVLEAQDRREELRQHIAASAHDDADYARWQKLMAERDEARAEAARLREVLEPRHW